MIVNEFVCGGSIQDAAQCCAKGTCKKCGFNQVWKDGLRKQVVDAYGNLRPGVDKVLWPMCMHHLT